MESRPYLGLQKKYRTHKNLGSLHKKSTRGQVSKQGTQIFAAICVLTQYLSNEWWNNKNYNLYVYICIYVSYNF